MESQSKIKILVLVESLTKIKIIIVCGPTASGKTAVCTKLAELLPIEIISADSRQIYRLLDIGTAKPTAEELRAAPYHFINILNPDEDYSAGRFGNDAAGVVREIHARGRIPVVCGGSGLYIKALCEGLFNEGDFDSEEKKEVRESLEKRLLTDGIEQLYDELKLCDPISANLYEDKNPRRVIRALLHYNLTGRALSESHKNSNPVANPFDVVYYGINIERDALYAKINRRAEDMWRNGLLDEVRNVLSLGYSPTFNSLNTVGYKEAIAYLNGFCSESEALELMQRNTRRYAKRQMTWFSRNEKIRWLEGSLEEMASKIIF
ncbi:MAG: miaA [Ignavibacteria bacterium]|nr:miaA [Ignavibacteria bacterium]